MITGRERLIGGADGSLRLRGLRGGAIAEITSFLSDMESAYNALYSFNQDVATWHDTRRFWRRPFGPEEFSIGFVFGRDLFQRDGYADKIPP